VRLHPLSSKLLLSDYLVILGWLDVLALTVCDTQTYRFGGFDPQNERTNQITAVPDQHDIDLLKACLLKKFANTTNHYGPDLLCRKLPLRCRVVLREIQFASSVLYDNISATQSFAYRVIRYHLLHMYGLPNYIFHGYIVLPPDLS
jgi:hypothetical protein